MNISFRHMQKRIRWGKINNGVCEASTSSFHSEKLILRCTLENGITHRLAFDVDSVKRLKRFLNESELSKHL